MSKRAKSPGWFCKECGYESINYLGRCPSCGEWSSLIPQPPSEGVRTPRFAKTVRDGLAESKPKLLAEIEIEDQIARLDTGFAELNEVLGGGMLPGAIGLIGGEPGIGKSTLLLQVLGRMAQAGLHVLYISGEESAAQVKSRAQRLGVNQAIEFMAETSLESVLNAATSINPALMIVDSIQTLHTDANDSLPGSPSQIRDCAAAILRLCKNSSVAALLVGHITKDGGMAGPKLLEHMVDVVLHFEGDRLNMLRIVRSSKNRFGPVGETAIFKMLEDGLCEVTNPSALFIDSSLERMGKGKLASSIVAIMQGTRPILAEVQALTGFTNSTQPKRMVNGLDYNRAFQLAALLERRLGLNLARQDIYLSTVGGLDISDPAADLAMALAMISCHRNLKLCDSLVVFGEVSLAGEIRPVTHLAARLKEAARLGFKSAIVPKGPVDRDIKQNYEDLIINPVSHLREVFKFAFAGSAVESEREASSAVEG